VLASGYITQWKKTQTVFDHAARVTEGNYVAYCNAGGEPLNDGRYGEAFERFFESTKYMFAELERKRLKTPYKNMIATNLAIAFCGTEGNGVERTAMGVKLTNDVVLSTKVKYDAPLATKKIFSQGLYAYWKELDSLAVQYFDEALKLAPNDDYLWRFKGYSLERRGLKEEALVAFKRSYALKPAKDIQKRIKALEQALAGGN
jgi:tetratricopeptide (TPR) repeat protein